MQTPPLTNTGQAAVPLFFFPFFFPPFSFIYIPLQAHVLQSENFSNIVYITLQSIIKRQENFQARWQDSHQKSFCKLSKMLSQQTQRKNSTSTAANNGEGDRRAERESEDSHMHLGCFSDPQLCLYLGCEMIYDH